MKTFFADSFFYFALLNASDAAHEQAEAFLENLDGKLVTTAWVLTELADGMADPLDRGTFVRLHESLSTDPDVTIVPPSPELFADGLALYAQRPDKGLVPHRLHLLLRDAQARSHGRPHWRPRLRAGRIQGAAPIAARLTAADTAVS